MLNIKFKTDRIRGEFESGNVDLHLLNILYLGMEWISLEYPEYKAITLTDILRTQDEQDKIYLNANDPEQVEMAKAWVADLSK